MGVGSIDRIYVSGYKYDVRFTRACVASIRAWYPDIPITLIKDKFHGDYSTQNIENWWDCDVLDTGDRVFGWGFGKLEPLFIGRNERFLVLDSDILFLGPVLARLESFDSDFVVQDEPDPDSRFVKANYYDCEALRNFDPRFEFPNFTFNSGQWVGRTNLVKRIELAAWIDSSNPPQLKQPWIFKLGEQGLLNYLLVKGVRENRWSLARDRFMEVGTNAAVELVKLENLGPNSAHQFLVHWCGCRHIDFAQMARGDLWQYFERRFYAKGPIGAFSKFWDQFVANLERSARGLARRIFPRKQVCTSDVFDAF